MSFVLRLCYDEAMTEPVPAPTPPPPSSSYLRLDWRLISLIFLLIIGGMLYFWKPWQSKSAAATKTITIRGEATVKAVPDSFQFQPIFQDADVKKLTATGNDAVAHLKQLGV